MTPVEIVSQSRDIIALEDIEFHPLVRAELTLELKKWTEALEKITPDRLQSVQGKIEILRWILSRMLNEILVKEREKALANGLADEV